MKCTLARCDGADRNQMQADTAVPVKRCGGRARMPSTTPSSTRACRIARSLGWSDTAALSAMITAARPPGPRVERTCWIQAKLALDGGGAPYRHPPATPRPDSALNGGLVRIRSTGSCRRSDGSGHGARSWVPTRGVTPWSIKFIAVRRSVASSGFPTVTADTEPPPSAATMADSSSPPRG